MKDYVPFNISYWLKLLKNLSSNIPKKNHNDSSLDELLNQQSNELSSLKSKAENNTENEDLLETIIEERRRFLVGSINQLDFSHHKRFQINYDLIYRIDYSIMYYKNLIYELDLWPRGYNSMIEKRRIHLEKLNNTLEQEKRKENTNCWSDILTVKRDLRTLLREYIELMIRKRIVQNK